MTKMVSKRMQRFMDRWALRKDPVWRPGRDHIDPRIVCVNCKYGSWYDHDNVNATFQLNGQYICRECRSVNPIQTALYQSIPYEVLSVVVQVCPPQKVKDVMWK